MARSQRETPVAVRGNDVFHDRARLGEHELAIGDHRRGADRMKGLVLRWSKQRRTRIALEFVRDSELFAEPDDPLGLRLSKVMNGQHAQSSLPAAFSES